MIRHAVIQAGIGHRLHTNSASHGLRRVHRFYEVMGKEHSIMLSESQINAYRTPSSLVMLFSSKPSHEKTYKSQDPSSEPSLTTDEDGDVPGKNEALKLFFEKRKAALAKERLKEKEQRDSRSDLNIGNGTTRPMMRNHGQQNNELKQQNRRRNDRKPWNSVRNNNHGRNNRFGRNNNENYENSLNNKKRPETLSDVMETISRRRGENQHQFASSRLQQHDKSEISRSNTSNRDVRNRSDINRSDKPHGTLRLAEMMKKLRKDAPPKLEQERFERAPSDTFYRRNKDNRASWRQKRFAIPSSEDGDQSRNGDNKSRRLGRRSRPAQAEEFLQGRISRTEDDDTDEIENTKEAIPDRVVTLPTNSSLSLAEISALFRVKVDDIKEKLVAMGVSTEDALDIDMLELLAIDFGIETTRSTNEPLVMDNKQLLMQQRRSDMESDETTDTSNTDTYSPRPPVVTIMGHVDHGKTTLMDALRRRSYEQQKKGKKGRPSKSAKKSKKSKNKGGNPSKNVAGTEAGGITQIISAFEVAMDGQDEKITFLDTPGHAAFRSMRQSGSHAADVIVLVVAADDGISEQTVEIINFYKSIVKGSSDNGISMVVAVNKIDKPGIDAEEAQMRIENQLLEHGIISEGMTSEGSEYGQPVQVIPTSGLTGQGLDDLMEGLLLQSEIMDLRADDTANGEGIIMDARQEKGLGIVADCIVRWGKIEKDNVIVSGDQLAQVRMLKDVNNKMIKNGLPSQPVRIIGFKSLPKAGDPIMVVESEEIAEDILEQRRALDIPTSDRPDGPGSDVELHITGMRRRDTWRVNKFTNRAAIGECDGTIRIPIIVKADADGSLAAIRESLLNIGDDSEHAVVIDPIMEGIGEVTSSDIQMAKESEATIFSFGSIQVDQSTLNLAEAEGVSICSNNIIYSLLDEAKDVLGSYLPLTPKEHTHGRAVVKAIFSVDTDNGEEKIAGLNVLEGNIFKSKAPVSDGNSSSSTNLDSYFRIYRDGDLISSEDDIVTASSLRRFKEMVESVRLGEECGLGLSGFTDFKEGDEIECYSVEMKKANL